MTPDSGKKHLSMLRSYTVADAFTLGNASCGTIALFLCLEYSLSHRDWLIWTAVALLFLALFWDVMDGYWARRSRRQSVLGADLDSLSDIVSFGVAPAVLGYTLGLRGGWDIVILVYFVVCGISRLARFNVTAAALSDGSGKVKYFEGAPIPTSVLIVAVLAAAFAAGAVEEELWLGAHRILLPTLHPLTLLYGASGTAMISATLRIPKP
ncbi:MAG: CDP-diacylglycerol--serine O-phosphatidyltransferase [Acidobacteria bacterium]|nr:CDP-diacylglycerol--serine O-phosphatidyltransferase [Acidobacteriota bacterium]